jgi:ParB family transcriptional regulator, chromosome partitioning protein
MASFKESMRGHVAGSMSDRFTVNQPDAPAPGRSALERQGDGRRRLDSACVLRLDRIVPDPAQPRVEFDEEALARLAESLKTRGQLQPIRVRWDEPTDRYVVVVGERRYRAAKLAGLETLACVVAAGNPTPEDLIEDQLVENALREDLKPVEQARAYKALLAARGLSQRQLAERLQIGHASIARSLALLELPEPIRGSVERGEIAPNTAYELTKVQDPAEQAELAHEAAHGRLRRDELKERTRAARSTSKPKGRGAKPRKVTERTFRTTAGPRVVVEFKRGLDDDLVIAAMQAVIDQVRAEESEAAA